MALNSGAVISEGWGTADHQHSHVFIAWKSVGEAHCAAEESEGNGKRNLYI